METTTFGGDTSENVVKVYSTEVAAWEYVNYMGTYGVMGDLDVIEWSVTNE